jgi:chemotaxis response regulator CheB
LPRKQPLRFLPQKKEPCSQMRRTVRTEPAGWAFRSSAGGLEALLDHMPADTGMAFVAVTHQHPGHTSLLPELLSRDTEMPVVEASDGVKIEPNHV